MKTYSSDDLFRLNACNFVEMTIRRMNEKRKKNKNTKTQFSATQPHQYKRNVLNERTKQPNMFDEKLSIFELFIFPFPIVRLPFMTNIINATRGVSDFKIIGRYFRKLSLLIQYIMHCESCWKIVKEEDTIPCRRESKKMYEKRLFLCSK